MSVTTQQVGLLHHTLGLRVDSRTPYRNHFVADAGHHDMPNLQALVGLGLMALSTTPKFCNASDIVFHVTDAGKALAIEMLPPVPKLTRSQQRYRDWIREDGEMRFGEWLRAQKHRRAYA